MSWESLGENVLGGAIWTAMASLALYLLKKARGKVVNNILENRDAQNYITLICDLINKTNGKMTAEKRNEAILLLGRIQSSCREQNKNFELYLGFSLLASFIFLAGSLLATGMFAIFIIWIVNSIFISFHYIMSPRAVARHKILTKVTEALSILTSQLATEITLYCSDIDAAQSTSNPPKAS